MKILVIDDDSISKRIIKYVFQSNKYRVVTANNGVEGIEKIDKEKPDLIFLDIVMPVMDGFKTCACIKSNPDTKDIPIFMISARTRLGDIEKAFQSGADDYIEKNTDLSSLEKKVLTKLKTINTSLRE